MIIVRIKDINSKTTNISPCTVLPAKINSLEEQAAQGVSYGGLMKGARYGPVVVPDGHRHAIFDSIKVVKSHGNSFAHGTCSCLALI